MSKETKIEWCDYSWSPWEGCTKVSPGCAACYAEANNTRWRGGANWGKGKPRRLTVNWGAPKRWNTQAGSSGRVSVFPSICDWLDDEVPVESLAYFLHLIDHTPNLDWLLLSKRPELWRERLMAVGKIAENWNGLDSFLYLWLYGQTPNNAWVGTSVEDQQRADERIPALLQIPARVRFLSVEPMLGPVDLNAVPWKHGGMAAKGWSGVLPVKSEPDDYVYWEQKGALQWVIVGGESGPRARPCNIAWVRDIVRQCKAAGVPCFVKQLGSHLSDADLEECARASGKSMAHPKGGDPSEWPEDLRVREFPEVKP